jgi:hypothetical protein
MTWRPSGGTLLGKGKEKEKEKREAMTTMKRKKRWKGRKKGL